MPKTLIILLSLLLINGCKYKHEVEPSLMDEVEKVYHLENEAQLLYRATVAASAVEEKYELTMIANAIIICYRNWNKEGDFFQYAYDNVDLPYVSKWVPQRAFLKAQPLYRQMLENGTE